MPFTRSSRSCRPLVLFTLIIATTWLQADSPPEGQKHKPNVKAWKASKEKAEAALKQHNLAEAESNYLAALAEAENFAADDYRLAQTLTGIGSFYSHNQRFAEAEPYLRRAAAARHGDPNPLTEAFAQHSLAFAAQQLGQFEEAEKAYLRAQELFSRKYGADHPIVAQCMFSLGTLYDDQQNYAKAEPLLKRSAALFENPSTRTVSRVGEDPANHGGMDVYVGSFRPDFAYAVEALIRLGTLYTKLDRIADSDASFKQALKLIDGHLSKNDPSVAFALREAYTILLSRNNYAGAEPFLERFVAFCEKTKGSGYATTLTAQGELALVYEREDKPEKAEALYKKIIATREKISGPDGDTTVAVAEPLIQLYFRQNRYADAEPVVLQQLAGIEKSGGGLALLPVLAEQITIYTKLNRDADLEGVYKHQLAVYEKMFGPTHKALLKTLNDYGALLHKMKRDAEAEALEARAKAIQADAK